MLILIDKFLGEAPIIANYLLPHYKAQEAVNTNIGRGDLRSWHLPSKEKGLTQTSVKTIFRYIANSGVNWAVSENALSVARSPYASDPYERVYVAGETEPRVLANDLISSPFELSTDYYKLGIPAPAGGPTIPGGGGSNYAAWYYTYYTRYDSATRPEEGPPCSAGSINTYNNTSIVLSNFSCPPEQHAIGGIRTYRTNSAESGAEFQKVKDTPLSEWDVGETYNVGDAVIYRVTSALYRCINGGTTSAPDDAVNGVGGSGAAHWEYLTITDDVAAADLGAVCPSEDWDPPPSGLDGFVGLANGSIAGFVGNQVWFSEPFRPHAWPAAYAKSLDQKVLGLGFFGTTVTPLTDGQNYVLFGNHPAQMQRRKLSGHFPLLNIRSIANTPYGVAFSTNAGLAMINQNGIHIFTINNTILAEEDWKKYGPESIHGCFHSDQYFGFYHSASGKRGFSINLKTGELNHISHYAQAVVEAYDDGEMYLVMDDIIPDGGGPDPPLCIKKWEGDPYNLLEFLWFSKRYMLPAHINFSTARVRVDQDFYNYVMEIMAANNYLSTSNEASFNAGSIGGSLNTENFNEMNFNGDVLISQSSISITPAVRFELWVDRVRVFEKHIYNDEIFRLPDGIRGSRLEIKLSGFIPVKQVAVANSVQEIIIKAA